MYEILLAGSRLSIKRISRWGLIFGMSDLLLHAFSQLIKLCLRSRLLIYSKFKFTIAPQCSYSKLKQSIYYEKKRAMRARCGEHEALLNQFFMRVGEKNEIFSKIKKMIFNRVTPDWCFNIKCAALAGKSKLMFHHKHEGVQGDYEKSPCKLNVKNELYFDLSTVWK